MIEIIKAWMMTRRQKDAHMKLMADHLLKCAQAITELRMENQELKQRGDALAFVYEHNDWSIEFEDQVALQVASWREMQGVAYE